jgi:hypothetical protein
MVELWPVKRVRSGARAGHDAALCGSRARVPVVAMRVKKLTSRLVAMYRMPCVHPLASITSDNRRKAERHGTCTWSGTQESADGG